MASVAACSDAESGIPFWSASHDAKSVMLMQVSACIELRRCQDDINLFSRVILEVSLLFVCVNSMMESDRVDSGIATGFDLSRRLCN